MLDDYEEDDECEIQTETFFGEIFVFFLPPNKTECFLHLLLTNRCFWLVFQPLISVLTSFMAGAWQPSGLSSWSLLTAAYLTWPRSNPCEGCASECKKQIYSYPYSLERVSMQHPTGLVKRLVSPILLNVGYKKGFDWLSRNKLGTFAAIKHCTHYSETSATTKMLNHAKFFPLSDFLRIDSHIVFRSYV